MLSRSRGPNLMVLGLLFSAAYGAACGSGGSSGGSGGGSATGGTGTGGSATGSSGTGGSATGGSGTGGAAGAASGGAGGPATGGSGTGGAATGGSGTGGAAGKGGGGAGGKATGGAGGSSGAGGAGGHPATGGGGGSAGSGGAGGTTTASEWVTIANGGFWNDTSGKRIEAHGGGFIQVGDTWYWVGEDKSMNSGNFFAVNIYASKDLSSWQFRNAIITRQTSTDLAAADRIIERPKIIYNDSTQQYVMWLHWDGMNYATAQAGVFTCATIDGNYKQVSHFQPNGNMARDDSLFKDDDGKAYFMAAANNNQDMIIYQLSDDYLTIKSQVVTVFAGKQREAPAMFKQNGRYYLITSAATGWDPNQAQYASATSIAGPWSSLTNLGDSITYDTQSAFVIPFVGSQTTTYIFAGDRWQDPDLVSSKYIWIPIQISGTSLTMANYGQWQLDVTTGHWSDDQNLIPQTGWSLIYADSQETSAENGKATNAFDGSTSTFWHTQYTGGATPYPHEIQIDLGATYALDGFRYLPRQDGSTHGMVAKWQFYASTDKTNWGTAVASGVFGSDGDTSEARVMFTRTTARYVRFVALSEINGNPWASVAELRMVGGAP
ncbi:MAG TPA: discoidin domain-containing protein [Polyangia bacterium]|nr:discoidin domain-containing protein [Polyangia bacterium]